MFLFSRKKVSILFIRTFSSRIFRVSLQILSVLLKFGLMITKDIIMPETRSPEALITATSPLEKYYEKNSTVNLFNGILKIYILIWPFPRTRKDFMEHCITKELLENA